VRIISNDNVNGILGTIIFHMVLVLLFLTVKIGDVRRKQMDIIPIEFDEKLVDIQEFLEKIENLPVEIEPLEEEIRRNIAVNVASQINDKISTEKYIEQIMKEEGIENLQQYLDRTLPDKGNISYTDEENISDNNEQAQDKEYTGPTNVTFYLENRFKQYLPIPVYTCKGGGLVVVNIEVNQKGNVISTSISGDSETNDECLMETAIKYASRTKFNSDFNAVPRQKGYIMYQFIPQ
jgi:hypothetical protein